MDYEARPPRPPHDRSVEVMFHLRGYCPEHAVERVVPDGSVNLVVELDGQPRHVLDNESHAPRVPCRHSWLSGMHQRFFSITAVQNTELFAFRFLPGGCYPLLKRPVADLSNQVRDAREFLGEAAEELRAGLLAAQGSEAKLACADAWLARHCDPALAPPAYLREAIEGIRGAASSTQVQALVDSLGYSRKHVAAQFKKYVGLTPKSFQRVLRFSAALARVQQGEGERVDWAGLSLDCGYSDQAHFIRDFREFSGYRPTSFAEQGSDRLNFFPVD